MSNDEKNLPKGFRYIQAIEVLEKLKILGAFTQFALGIGARIVEFPPVSFLSTYTTGAEITGDKIYTFRDRKGRDLVLTPDSLGHAFSFYLDSSRQNDAMRLAWICPTFRYRNIKNRHFLQIGFTSLNTSNAQNVFELAVLARALLKFIQKSTNLSIHLRVMNPGLVKEVLLDIFKEEEIAISLYEEWRKADLVEQIDLLRNRLPICPEGAFLLDVLSNGVTESESWLLNRQYKEIDKIKDFICSVNYDNFVNCSIDLTNTHSSEVMTSVGFIIETENHQKIGDGGLYDTYGNSFCNKIHTVASVCTGLDAIFRYLAVEEVSNRKLALVFSCPFNDRTIAMRLSDSLMDKQFDVRICFESKSKKVKRFIEDSEWCCMVEKIEDDRLFGKVFQPSLSNSQQVFSSRTILEVVELLEQS